MKIAVVSNTSWSIYNFRLNLIRALATAGHDALAVGSFDQYLERLRTHGIAAEGVPFTGKGVHPLRELQTVFALRRHLRRRAVDLVLSFTPKGNLYTAFALRGSDAVQVANVSGLGTAFARESAFSRFVQGLYRVAFRRVRHVFFQNEDDRAVFIGKRLVAAAKTERLPGSGVDLAHFQPAPWRDDAGVVVLMFCRLLWEKGVGEYVEAARQLRREFPDARFQLMGASETDAAVGADATQLKAWAAEGTIEYLGHVDDVRATIANADCVVLPTAYREGVPRSLLEAAAMGRPVVAGDMPGTRDALEDGVTGFLCRPRDTPNLVTTLRRSLLLGRETWRAMGAKGRAKMEREFDERLVIERYLQLVAEIARERAPR